MLYLFLTALFFTICTVSDKYTLSKYSLSSSDFTFLIAASSCVFLLPAMLFTEIFFRFSASSILTVIFVTIDKIAEFSASAAVLKKLSGFETKAWLGTALFLSYFSDIAFFGERFEILRLLFIIITCVCLVFMVRGSKNTDKSRYKSIWFILIIYILSKYFYGVIIKTAVDISPMLSLYVSMVIITIIYLFKADLKGIFGNKRKGTAIVFFTRIPNTAGLILENILIGLNLTMYSLEQPLILAMLLIYSFIRRESTSKISIISGIACFIAILAFKLL